MRLTFCLLAALLATACQDATIKLDPFLAQAPRGLSLQGAIYGVQLLETGGEIRMDGLQLILWEGSVVGDPCDLEPTEGLQLNIYTPTAMGGEPMDAPAFVSGPVDRIGLDDASTPMMLDGQVRFDGVLPEELELECDGGCVVTNAPRLIGAALIADADGPLAAGNFDAVHCPNIDAHGVLEAGPDDAR